MFAEIIKKRHAERKRAYELTPNDFNKGSYEESLFAFSMVEKESPPIKYKLSKEALDKFYKLIDSIGRPVRNPTIADLADYKEKEDVQNNKV